MAQAVVAAVIVEVFVIVDVEVIGFAVAVLFSSLVLLTPSVTKLWRPQSS